MSVRSTSFSEVKLGQIFSHRPGPTPQFFIKTTNIGSEGEGEYNSVALTGPPRGRPCYFFDSENVLVPDDQQKAVSLVVNQQSKSAISNVSFVDCDGGKEDGISTLSADADADV